MKKSLNMVIIFLLTFGIVMLKNYQINTSKISYVAAQNYQPASINESIEISTNLEKISLIAKLGYDEFTYPEFTYDDSDEVTMEEVNAYRDAKRRAGKLYHAIKNRQIFSSLNIGDYDSAYVCSLLPFVEITYSQSEYEKNKDEVLAKLTSHRDITNVTIQSTYVEKKIVLLVLWGKHGQEISMMMQLTQGMV